jgi:predicted signal transduction protein with EAL and GGDEF domain
MTDTPDPVLPSGSAGDPGAGADALTARLAEEFGADRQVMARVASLFVQLRDRAPDLFVPAPGTLAAALAGVVSPDGGDPSPVYAALGEWALDAAAEPVERIRRDCLHFQSAMTRGALRLHAQDPERCGEIIAALQRFNVLQLALLAARGQVEGGVMRTLPTPEYAAFMETFRATVESHRKEGRQLALLVIDVERIEQVDRLLGLQKGEAFMLRVIRRLREGVLRRQDQLGRLSRGQLGCLLPHIAGEGVAILAANKILGALEAPVPIGERSFAPDIAVGIAMFPEHGADQQTLVRNGKLAARAARGTPERAVPYEAAYGEAVERKVRREMRLRAALEENALRLAFEPQLDLSSGDIVRLECVLRWTDDALGEMSEATAIKVAEASGLILGVARWMFNNALRICADFSRAGVEFPLAVKAGASVLLQPDFPELVDRALRTWGVPPDRLAIEVHESALAGELDAVKETLVRLKALGLRLGIDGFGMGASSLSNLARLPIDEVRIDGSLVSDMLQDAIHAKIVRSLVHLAQDMEFRVSAGGVEDAETARVLGTLGCERIQGGYVGAPLTPEEILEKFASRP